LTNVVTDFSDLHRFDVYVVGTAEQLQIAKRLFLKQVLPKQRWRAGSYCVSN